MQFPFGIYLVKVNNENTKIMYEICSNSTIKTPNFRYLERKNIYVIRKIEWPENTLRVYEVWLKIPYSPAIRLVRSHNYLMESNSDTHLNFYKSPTYLSPMKIAKILSFQLNII